MEIKKPYRKLCIAILSAWIFLAMPPSINANTENRERHGNCFVWTDIDAFTNAETHILNCIQYSPTDLMSVKISQSAPKKLELDLNINVIDYEDDEIQIALRIDKGKWIKMNARWNSNAGSGVIGSATIDGTQLPPSFMNEFANGKRLNLQVGKKKGYIILKGSFAAVSDFKQRVKTLINADASGSANASSSADASGSANTSNSASASGSADDSGNTDASGSADDVNKKTYGNCEVVTQIDTSTDAEFQSLSCKEKTSTNYTEVTINQGAPGKPVLWLSKGKMSHEGDEISIALRIDKGKLIKTNARWVDPEWAYITDSQIALSVMNELANGKKVVIKVGEARGSIILDGAKDAVQDFNQRIKPSINTYISNGYDIGNEKIYGNCHVGTRTDLLTDAESYFLSCGKSVTSVVIIQSETKELALLLSENDIIHEENEIAIALKIDKGKWIEKDALWTSDARLATIADTKLALSVMNELANGKRVVIKVGEERGSITLNGTSEAVKDFKKRINYP